MNRNRAGSHPRLALVVLLLCLPLFVAAHAGAAPAGTTPPCTPGYTCVVNNPPPAATPTCSLSDFQATPGSIVTGRLDNAPVGLEARLLFDGIDVARGAATGSGSVSLSFTIPAGTKVGPHTAVFVGTGFQCDATRITPLAILGETFVNRSLLGRTGITLAVYLAIALVLLVGGAALVFAARQRRRSKESHHGVALKKSARSL